MITYIIFLCWIAMFSVGMSLFAAGLVSLWASARFRGPSDATSTFAMLLIGALLIALVLRNVPPSLSHLLKGILS